MDRKRSVAIYSEARRLREGCDGDSPQQQHAPETKGRIILEIRRSYPNPWTALPSPLLTRVGPMHYRPDHKKCGLGNRLLRCERPAVPSLMSFICMYNPLNRGSHLVPRRHWLHRVVGAVIDILYSGFFHGFTLKSKNSYFGEQPDSWKTRRGTSFYIF